MDRNTIILGAVVIVIIGGVLFVASRSPAAQSAVGGALGFGEPARDNTAGDVGAVLGGIGGVLNGVGNVIGSVYGGGLASAAGGTSKAGVA